MLAQSRPTWRSVCSHVYLAGTLSCWAHCTQIQAWKQTNTLPAVHDAVDDIVCLCLCEGKDSAAQLAYSSVCAQRNRGGAAVAAG